MNLYRTHRLRLSDGVVLLLTPLHPPRTHHRVSRNATLTRSAQKKPGVRHFDVVVFCFPTEAEKNNCRCISPSDCGGGGEGRGGDGWKGDRRRDQRQGWHGTAAGVFLCVSMYRCVSRMGGDPPVPDSRVQQSKSLKCLSALIRDESSSYCSRKTYSIFI